MPIGNVLALVGEKFLFVGRVYEAGLQQLADMLHVQTALIKEMT